MPEAEFVDSYFDAWNRRDPRAVAAHLATDGIYCDIPENTQRTQAELIVSLDEFFRTHPHRYERIGRVLTSPDGIAFQYRMRPPAGMPGGAGPISGAEFITFDGAAALRIADYYDRPGRQGSPVSTRLNRSPGKYAKSGLDSERLGRYKVRLERKMRQQRLYLQPDLTLPKLASEMGCSVNHISQAINAGFGMNFFEWVSRYRIEEAKRLLACSEGRPDAVLRIAFRVGFNSNSTFYAAFRKQVGQTPSQYRRNRGAR